MDTAAIMDLLKRDIGEVAANTGTTVGGMKTGAPPNAVEQQRRKATFLELLKQLKTNPNAQLALLKAAAAVAQPIDPRTGESPLLRIIEGLVAGTETFQTLESGDAATLTAAEDRALEREKQQTDIAHTKKQTEKLDYEMSGEGRLFDLSKQQLELEKLRAQLAVAQNDAVRIPVKNEIQRLELLLKNASALEQQISPDTVLAQAAIEEAGGLEAWNKLTGTEKERLRSRAQNRMVTDPEIFMAGFREAMVKTATESGILASQIPLLLGKLFEPGENGEPSAADRIYESISGAAARSVPAEPVAPDSDAAKNAWTREKRKLAAERKKGYAIIAENGRVYLIGPDMPRLDITHHQKQ